MATNHALRGYLWLLMATCCRLSSTDAEDDPHDFKKKRTGIWISGGYISEIR